MRTNFTEIFFNSAKTFNPDSIIKEANLLDFKRTPESVITLYNNREINETLVSPKYQIFDFVNLIVPLVNNIHNFFTPYRYSFNIYGGIQELKIFGDKIEINGESYYRILNILNSSNKSRSLQINMGLLRQVCANGLMIGVGSHNISVKGRHFKNSLEKTVNKFNDEIKNNFEDISKLQIEKIKKLSSKTIQLENFVEDFIIKLDKNDNKMKIKQSQVSLMKKLGEKILFSTSDRVENASPDLKRLLYYPAFIVEHQDNKKMNIPINGLKLFNCYTEIFREEDSAKQYKESQRILEYI